MTSQFTNDLSKEVYETTYRYGDETIEDTQHRVAYDIASVEVDRDFWTTKFIDILKDFKFVPGGRILSNAGVGLKGTTYINCFVDGFVGKDPDSMNGISNALSRQAQILKSEGGYGFCADVMRPRGGFIDGIANETPGAVRMLDMWNTQSYVITAGSGKKSDSKKSKQKIRKGAQMVTLSCWHPDIEEFITAKQTSGRLDKFNMSVLITDDFMNAIVNNDEWNLYFPDFDKVKGTYEDEWDGNIKKWIDGGHPIKIYKTYKNANELWDLIMKSTYNRNEPGVLFIDVINRFNNLYYLEYISATNPCGEQILPIGGVCLLGSLNLTQFIKGDDWDYDKLKEIIPLAIRFMDNVNDLTYVPLIEQKDNLKKKRRIGMGIMGYGSALLMMKKRYGSKEVIKMTDKLMQFIANTAYQSSALLAKEKGYFPLYQEEKYLKSKFIENLSDETKNLIKKHGIRNSHLLSIQPTGNCVRKNTKIRTDKGILSLNEIFKMNNIDISKTDKNKWYIPIQTIKVETINSYERIIGLYVNDKKQIISVKTKNNNLIECTFEEKLLVKLNDKEATWKKLKDIKINDIILSKKKNTTKNI